MPACNEQERVVMATAVMDHLEQNFQDYEDHVVVEGTMLALMEVYKPEDLSRFVSKFFHEEVV
uniref:Uncharacterized protein n=1 Tax=Candidatus Kentrum sp. LFY TaxID=2126342 RepID=A0A450WGQ8_9GAMM|nr:MAG: hypothetical protein BECKLFY1418C_GA0070996_102229 [Candidatus Kentron sp. LFY]